MLQALVRRQSIFYIIIGVAILVPLPFALSNYWLLLLSKVLIFALFATSTNIEMGYAGMMPLGQSMFLGFGAYTYGILFLKSGLSMPLAILGSLVLSLFVNIGIGFLCLRGKAFTFGILHMGFNILATIIIAKWLSMTGGDTGLTGIPRPGLFSSPLMFYFLVLAIVLICYIIIWMIVNSPFGRIAQGLRENEERLSFLGINTKMYQLTIFVMVGFFSAVAGILLAMLNRGTFPQYVAILQSAQVMMMCLIGGMFNFMGPTLGAVIIVIFSSVASDYTRYWEGLIGIIMIVCVIALRGGILKAKRARHTGGEEKQPQIIAGRDQ
jgi:branched-chain amino acid transport system permease protein